MSKSEWKWFGNAGHFICGHDCRFHLCTQVGEWLVSTVGQLCHDSAVRRILAESRDPKWYAENGKLKGDYFDAAYQQKFGFEDIGYNRKFETMVFKAGAPCALPECGCGLPKIDGAEVDFNSYQTAGEANAGHLAMCEKWAKKKSPEA